MCKRNTHILDIVKDILSRCSEDMDIAQMVGEINSKEFGNSISLLLSYFLYHN